MKQDTARKGLYPRAGSNVFTRLRADVDRAWLAAGGKRQLLERTPARCTLLCLHAPLSQERQRALRDLPGFRPGALKGPTPIDSVGNKGRGKGEGCEEKGGCCIQDQMPAQQGQGQKQHMDGGAANGHGIPAGSRHSRSPTRTRGAPATGPPRRGQ